MALPKLEAARYEMKLPSTGEKVIYRPYLVKEEKILMLAMESEDTKQMVQAVKDIINACTDGAINVERITMFDLEYMFSQLRSKSVGETATVNVTCQYCKAKNELDINLSHMRVDVPKKKQHTIELTDTIGITLKYPPVDAVLETQMDEKSSEIDKVFMLIESCIDSIYSGDEIFDAKEQTKAELQEFIESLNTEQFNRIKDFITNMPSAIIDVDFKCMSCDKQNTFEVKGLANFFG